MDECRVVCSHHTVLIIAKNPAACCASVGIGRAKVAKDEPLTFWRADRGLRVKVLRFLCFGEEDQQYLFFTADHEDAPPTCRLMLRIRGPTEGLNRRRKPPMQWKCRTV